VGKLIKNPAEGRIFDSGEFPASPEILHKWSDVWPQARGLFCAGKGDCCRFPRSEKRLAAAQPPPESPVGALINRTQGSLRFFASHVSTKLL
jgi:hypothetical protein